MTKPFKYFVHKTVDELADLVGAMVIKSPTFKDRTGYFPGMNLENTFDALYEGLHNIRREIGEDMYVKLKSMSDQMRALYESDQENNNGGTTRGMKINIDMEHILDQYLRDAAVRRKLR